MEKLWTTAEVATCLGISEGEVEQLVREGKLTGYKLGGQFLRFQPQQVKGLQGTLGVGARQVPRAGASQAPKLRWQGRLRDFLYLYDFYILSVLLLIGVMVYLMSAG
ncbi:MAG: helix-turn-helix domain-containing protein [Candidatus Omnitrophica bacterium]|nr:helix-turn-helix domain-containing protein [Candidatus Omnitrophota bacterium]